MARKNVRTIAIELEEDTRGCAYCQESLTGADTALYIIVGPLKRGFEFCSWNCLFRWSMRLLYHKALDIKLRSANVLSSLGFTHKWGATIPAAELLGPGETRNDKDSKAEDKKRKRRRKGDGPTA